MTTQTTRISVGQLVAMSDRVRAETIKPLSGEVRRKLAHLAALSARENTKRAGEHVANNHPAWARTSLAYAAQAADLAAELTADEERL